MNNENYWTQEKIDAIYAVKDGRPEVHLQPLDSLVPFRDHPFQVRQDAEMAELTESIRSQGILMPLVLRPLEPGKYEVVSGHRRLHAAKALGMTEVPAIIYPLSRDAATIALVDSNLHREKLLPSEKAFAYKLKMDAMSRQGHRSDLTSRQIVGKLETADMIADNESGRQVQRYIRLTNLIPGILQKVDEGRIALTPAVELSYLTETEQANLLETMESEDCTPSLTQAIALKQTSQNGKLTMDRIFTIMTQRKPNQQEKISFRTDEVRKFFPRNYTATQMQEVILKLLGEYQRKREQNRDAR